jgi:hypothetical protein
LRAREGEGFRAREGERAREITFPHATTECVSPHATRT